MLIPEVGAIVLITLSEGVQCCAIVNEVTKDDPPCVVCQLIGTEQRFHIRVTEIEAILDQGMLWPDAD